MQAPSSDLPPERLAGSGARPSEAVTDEAGSTATRLRQIATELFAERGYAGTSLAEIASRLGIRKPSLYNYYRSKDELFLDLFETSLGAWRQASRPPLEAALEEGAPEGDADFWQRTLYRHLRNTMEFGARSPHDLGLCRVAVGQVTGETEIRVLERLEVARRDFQILLERFFRAAVDAGEIVDIDPDVLAYSWKTFIDGVLTHKLFGPERHGPLAIDNLDGLWSLYWRGIARRPEVPATCSTGEELP